MNIKPSHVEKFKILYKETFKEEISDEEAFEQCLKLVLLIKATYIPISPTEKKRLKECYLGDLKK
ncbi:hypothetical protein AUJ26_02210 [Candidatus Falkowbacteria bacterium CG1_02_37_21]|nr:hypothetical protein [Candidatus Falkowbacteria bacterium]OIO05802.1 MAG: hypothetical protein AUJ26_02210 [Candidatus Falkowbacteria bacterium CG1_02_37_21]